MNTKVLCFLLGAALITALPSTAFAQYQVLHGHFGNGGGVRSGGGYGVYDTAGQPAIGVTAGASNWVKGGFWYCAGISSTVDVAFASFLVELRDDAVLLAWEASASAPFEGFHIYRSETTEEALERITEAPVPAGSGTEYRDERVLAGKTYLYRIGAVSREGEWFSPTLSVSLPPKPTTLYQNYPNPFNPATSIAFYLASASPANLSIFDVRGARVRTLVERELEAGRHVETWDGRNDAGARVDSGVYYYRLRAGKDLITRKLVIVR
jgi:hypothetical protein